jgi:polysaccharide biosynthesis/export protein
MQLNLTPIMLPGLVTRLNVHLHCQDIALPRSNHFDLSLGRVLDWHMQVAMRPVTQMLKGIVNRTFQSRTPGRYRKLVAGFSLLAAGAVLFSVVGCQSTPPTPPPDPSMDHPEAFSLREGDVVRISFPGAPSLDTTQQVRRDGKISLPLAGEVQAAGYRPAELEKNIQDLCGSQLVSKEVDVTVISSAFPVFVSGAVLKPGKVQSDRPLTVLQAIMEAGGFYNTANLKAVVVIRHENGKARNYTVDVQSLLQGKSHATFYLKPSDIVYVPQKFW